MAMGGGISNSKLMKAHPSRNGLMLGVTHWSMMVNVIVNSIKLSGTANCNSRPQWPGTVWWLSRWAASAGATSHAAMPRWVQPIPFLQATCCGVVPLSPHQKSTTHNRLSAMMTGSSQRRRRRFPISASSATRWVSAARETSHAVIRSVGRLMGSSIAGA